MNKTNSENNNHILNPATGLPMVGILDIDGNPYGQEPDESFVNPATGNTMVGWVDTHGNSFGSSSND